MLKLYTTPASPFGARVRIQIYKKNIPVDILPPPGDFGSAELQKINPLGKIPVLETETSRIIESEVIQEYLQNKFPEPSMLGASDEESARIRILSRITDLYLLPALLPLRAALRQAASKQMIIDGAIKELDKVFGTMESFMSGGKYAVSDNLSLADCSMIPLFYYLENFSQSLDFDLGLRPYERLSLWRDHISDDSAVNKVLTEIEQALT